ncbi:MAG: hypothetical protein KGS72_21625 [Cyanobacteria bacterium REEB67]|nr:hypothetical protein [Cyanobacteria bacterium REEB67]
MKRAILAIALVLAPVGFLQPGAQAQFVPKLEERDTRDQTVMQAIEDYMTARNGNHTLKKFRYGVDEKQPLGQYYQEPNFAFKSDYAKLSTDQQAKFAYDLNQYRKAAGLDWETQHPRTVDWKYMPYEKQHDFAEFYWLRNSPEFKNCGILDKSRFIYESLIDATEIYLAYRRTVSTSADTVIYGDSAIQHLIKKDP